MTAAQEVIADIEHVYEHIESGEFKQKHPEIPAGLLPKICLEKKNGLARTLRTA
ncbi:MAG: hypothetical protein AABY92_03305 [Thermodesulfobacteriota bacterium]